MKASGLFPVYTESVWEDYDHPETGPSGPDLTLMVAFYQLRVD